MATLMRNNSTSSLSSVSSIGSDNVDATGKGVKGSQDPTKNRNLVQRTRDALGDIGNRLKKNPVLPGGKAQPAIKKATLGTKNEFTVPVSRAPRAAASKPGKTLQVVGGKSLQAKPTSESRKEILVPDVVEVGGAGLESVNKNATDGKTGNYSEYEVATEANVEDKENVPNVSEQTTAVVVEKNVPAVVELTDADNEYNPKLPTENAIEAFSSDRLNIVNIDVDEWNPLLVQVYVHEIYDYVFALEKKCPVRIRYLEGRLINSRMRAVLLDWLVEVHQQFGFMPETLYLTAKILDRYLQADRSVTRKQLQLVGVTAMYIAAKYEEVCTPAVQDFAAVSDNAFTVGDVKKMEEAVLTTLSFDLAFPPAVLFLRRFSKAANASMAIHSMAKYIMELSLVDYAACHLYPSEQAAGSLALSLLILGNKSLLELWTPTLQHYSRYNFDSIKSLVSVLAGVLSRAVDETQKLKAVYNKYARKRLNLTSLAPELQVELWRNRVLKEVCTL